MDPVPKKKPITREKFEEKVDLYMQGLFGGMGKELMLPLLNKVYQEAKDAGVVTPEEAYKYAQDKSNYYKDLNMRQQMRAPFAEGTKPILTNEDFIRERTAKTNMNNTEFADYINKKYRPQKTKKFTGNLIDKKLRIAQEKGLIEKDFVYKGSSRDRALTPEKYKKMIGEKEYEKLKDNPVKLKEKYEYEQRKKNPDFLIKKNKRERERLAKMSPKDYEDKILEKARKRIQESRGSVAKFYSNRKDPTSMAWKDLVSRAHESKSSDPFFRIETPIKEGKVYSADEMKKIVLIDKNNNKYKYNTLFDDVEKVVGKNSAESFKSVYDQRAFLNKEGLTKQLNELYGIQPGSRKSVFNIQHIEGFNKNPFNVHITFADQNLQEAYARKKFTNQFSKAKSLSEKKQVVNNYYKSLGDDIVSQLGKKPKGNYKTLEQLLTKTGIDLKPSMLEKVKAFPIKKFGKYASQVARPVVRLAAPIIPFVGPAIMASGAYDVAKAAEQGYTSPDELGAAYYLGPEAAKGLDSLKEKIRGQKDDTEAFVP